MNDFASEIAHAIMPAYLWWSGYDFNQESLQECHESIEIQRQENEVLRNTVSVLVVDPAPTGPVEQSREASARELPWLHSSSQRNTQRPSKTR